jgi:hypothetical protein
MNLGENVSFRLDIKGRVTGRTFEIEPKVDIELPWGTLVGVPVSVLEQSDPLLRETAKDAATDGEKPRFRLARNVVSLKTAN